MKGLWRYNGLSITLLLLFLLCWGGQTITGWYAHNEDLKQHREHEISLANYFGTGHFIEATFENWESEFLQMAAYVVLTVFLFQKGSSESKDPDNPDDQEPDPTNPDAPAPVKQGGWALLLYQNSLAIVFSVLFLLSWFLHAVGGAKEYSQVQQQFGQPAVSTLEFMRTSEFWFQSFQNWQSEFLSVSCIVIFTIWLRQKNSPESKPVDAPHSQTGA